MAGPSHARRAKLGEAAGRAKKADSRYAVAMMRSAASAPHLGAALAAGLIVATGLAFRAGAQGGEPVTRSATEPGQIVSELQIHPRSQGVDEETSATASAEAAIAARPMLAVIIDDVGLDTAAAERLLALEMPLTVSILPYAAEAPEVAAAARRAGKEVFLHLPMEPVGLDDPGPLALTGHHSGQDLSVRAEWALSRVPGASGFNNHMGSRLTADAQAMDRLFASLSGRGLVFVDSLTSPDSVAGARARAAGLTALRRDVFLDHDAAPAAVAAALEEALDLAAERGFAVAIGHPHATTLDALETLSARADAAGIELVTAGALAARLRPAARS